MAFGSCSRSQLLLIFGNTLAFFVAGTLLGFALYVFGNLRNSDVTVVSMCLGKLGFFGVTRRIANPVPLLAAASACVMISTAMGAWGALLKKHGVLKAYFYTVLLLVILLAVTGTLCYVLTPQMQLYVDYDYYNVKMSMPRDTCADGQGTDDCKTTLKDKIRDDLSLMGLFCLLMGLVMLGGVTAAGRLLSWNRLTGPLLHGGGVVMVAFGVLNLMEALNIINNQTHTTDMDSTPAYLAIVGPALVACLGLMGIMAMRTRSPCLITAYQVIGAVTVILSCVLSALAFSQFNSIEQWTIDNFDTGANVRSKLDVCYCNNYDTGPNQTCGPTLPNVECNARTGGSLSYYTCNAGTCNLNQHQTLCLSTEVCAKKAANSAQLSLGIIGSMACWYLIYILVCLAASSSIKANMLDEQRQETAQDDTGYPSGNASAVVSKAKGVDVEMNA